MTREEYLRRKQQIDEQNPIVNSNWNNGFGWKDAIEGSDAAKAWNSGFGAKDAIEGSAAAKAWESGFGAKDGIQSWAEGAGFLGNGKAPLEKTPDQTLKQSSLGAMPKAMQQSVDPASETEQPIDEINVTGTQDKLSDIFAEDDTATLDGLDNLKKSNDIALQNLRRSQASPFAPRLGGGTIKLTR